MDEKINMEKYIAIIGNGFDLGSGLKTSYGDFFNDLELTKHDKYKTLLAFINSLNEYKMDVSEYGVNKTFEDIECSLKKWIAENTDVLNFWEIYFYLNKKNIKNSNWNDIETEIEKIVLDEDMGIFKLSDINIELFGGKRGVVQTHYQFESVDGSELINLTKRVSEQRMKNFSFKILCKYFFNLYFKFNCDENESKYDFLLKELERFEKEFSAYIYKEYNETVINEHTETVNDENLDGTYISNFLEVFRSVSSCYILNFNYTVIGHLLDNSKEREYGDIYENHVHGECGEGEEPSIIFGIDHNTAIDEQEAGSETYIFSKSYRKMKLNHTSFETLPSREGMDRIVFFGHSLSKADYSYFQSLFDYYNIYDSNVKLEFYYSDFDGQNRHKEHALAVQKLLLKYGETMSNKDHGKNIIPKLILENRLQIIEQTLEKIKRKVVAV